MKYFDTVKEKTMNFKRGDVIEIERYGGLYKHYGIYVGNGKVVHHAGKGGDFGGRIVIHKASMDEFINNGYGNVNVVRYKNGYSGEKTAQRAEASVKESSEYQKKYGGNYNLVSNNCEHLAEWCATGKHESRQVKEAEKKIIMGIAATVLRIPFKLI